MGYIKEPAGIAFVVDPTPLTKEERKKISEIIAYYKITGRKMSLKKLTTGLSRKVRTGSATNAEKKKAFA